MIERHKLLSARGRSAKVAANGIQTHTRTNQRRTLASRSQQSLNAGRLYTTQLSQH